VFLQDNSVVAGSPAGLLGARPRWRTHGLAVCSSVLLVVAGVGWLTGGASVASARTGIALDSEAARSLAVLVGSFKGLLDLWPVPLGAWFALRGDLRAAAVTWAVATVFIPLADLLGVLWSGGGLSGAITHLVYLAAMGGAALAYQRATSVTGASMKEHTS